MKKLAMALMLPMLSSCLHGPGWSNKPLEWGALGGTYQVGAINDPDLVSIEPETTYVVIGKNRIVFGQRNEAKSYEGHNEIVWRIEEKIHHATHCPGRLYLIDEDGGCRYTISHTDQLSKPGISIISFKTGMEYLCYRLD